MRRLRLVTGRLLASIEPDGNWVGMFRVRLPDHLTDMVNLTRAKDAAIGLALGDLNRFQAPRKPRAAPPIRFSASGLSTHYQA